MATAYVNYGSPHFESSWVPGFMQRELVEGEKTITVTMSITEAQKMLDWTRLHWIGALRVGSITEEVRRALVRALS